MITEQQYLFFKSQYEEETTRYSELIKKSQIYLSIQSFLLTAVFFKINDIVEVLGRTDDKEQLMILFASSLAIIFISILLNVFALRITKFEKVNDLENVVAEFNDSKMDNGEFFKLRIVDFTVATGRNAKANDRSARFLQSSLIVLAIGLLLTIVFLTMTIFKS